MPNLADPEVLAGAKANTQRMADQKAAAMSDAASPSPLWWALLGAALYFVTR